MVTSCAPPAPAVAVTAVRLARKKYQLTQAIAAIPARTTAQSEGAIEGIMPASRSSPPERPYSRRRRAPRGSSRRRTAPDRRRDRPSRRRPGGRSPRPASSASFRRGPRSVRSSCRRSSGSDAPWFHLLFTHDNKIPPLPISSQQIIERKGSPSLGDAPFSLGSSRPVRFKVLPSLGSRCPVRFHVLPSEISSPPSVGSHCPVRFHLLPSVGSHCPVRSVAFPLETGDRPGDSATPPSEGVECRHPEDNDAETPAPLRALRSASPGHAAGAGVQAARRGATRPAGAGEETGRLPVFLRQEERREREEEGTGSSEGSRSQDTGRRESSSEARAGAREGS